MEVTSRRLLQKHLEPARPLRRCSNGVLGGLGLDNGGLGLDNGGLGLGPMRDADPYKQLFVDANRQVEQFCRILQLEKQGQEEMYLPGRNEKPGKRISYSREFLIELAKCPLATKKPQFLPEHPVVLEKARDWAPLAEEYQ